MASFQVTGFISNITYKQGFCLVFVDEYKKGYRKKDGTQVDDKYLSWKCLFKQGLVKFVSEHFSKGMLVEVKGEVLPYAIEQDKFVDGYTILAQCINMASFPRADAKQELKMIRDSQATSDEKPDLSAFKQDDF